MTGPMSSSSRRHLADLAGSNRSLPSALKLPKIALVEARPEVAFTPEETPEEPFLPIQRCGVNRSFNQSPAARYADNSPHLYHTLLPDQDFNDPDDPAIVRLSAMNLAGYAQDPYDPARPFSLAVPFGVAMCPTLASYAAARCGW